MDPQLYKEKFVDVIQTTSEWIWLPPGVKWSDMAGKPNLANLNHFWMVIPGTILLLIFRLFMERIVFYYFGLWLGVPKPKQQLYKPNEILEKEFQASKGRKLNKSKKKQLCKETGKSDLQVEAWFRRRQKATLTPVIVKFSESAFRFVFYFVSFAFGMHLLINRPWFWDVTDCWKNLPFDDVDEESKLYYAIQLSYYFGCLITLPFDNKRKDFKELVIHHIATVALIFFSYMSNYWKIGTLVMSVHDVSDIVLDLAKSFNYAKYTACADNLFVVFAIVFFISRIVIFPFHILRSVLFDPVYMILGITSFDYVFTSNLPWIPTYFIFSILLLVLFALHIFWFSIIVRMAISMVSKGHVEGDARSDQGETTDDDNAAMEDKRKESCTKLDEDENDKSTEDIKKSKSSSKKKTNLRKRNQ